MSPYTPDVDYNKLDTIIHEYGHTVAQGAGFFPYETAEKGFLNHYLDSDLRIQKGYYAPELLELAFSEGWADFFSMAAQSYMNVRNSIYPFDGQYGSYDVETVANDLGGESDEIGIMRILWDLADPKGEGTTDRVLFSYGGYAGVQALFKLIDDKDIRKMSDLWKAIVAATPALPNGAPDVATLSAYGAVFAANGASVRSLSMNVGGVSTTVWKRTYPLPTFSWQVPVARGLGGPSQDQILNQFEILIFDNVNNTYSKPFDSGMIPVDGVQITVSGGTAT